MAVTDGKIKLTDADANSIEISVPSYPYKTIIDLPWDITKLDTGKYEAFDNSGGNSALYDIRRCQCKFLLTAADQKIINDFIKEDDTGTSRGRAANLTLEMNANSGFFPFCPDKSNVGPFTIALTIIGLGKVGESPFRYFEMEVEMVNVAAFPAYILPAEVAEGDLTIGTVSNLRFPPQWFKPKAKYQYSTTITQDSTAEYFDRGEGGDWYTSHWNQVCNGPNAGALISYLVDTARTNEFDITPPDDAYMFGRDNGAENTYTVNLIQNKITITHSRYNEFSFPLSVSFVSVPASGVLAHIDNDDQGGRAKGVAVDDSNTPLYVFLANDSRGVESYSCTTSGVLAHIDNDDQGGAALGVAVDNINTDHLVFLANDTDGLEVYKHAAGVLTHLDSDDQGGNARNVVVDPILKLAFIANNARGIDSYRYTTGGILTHVDNDYQGVLYWHIAIDTTNKLLFASNASVLLSYSYDMSGNLTFLDSDTQGGQPYGMGANPTTKNLFLGNDTRGIESYSYTTGGILTHLDNDSPGGGWGANALTTGVLVFFAYGSGGIITYTQKNGLLTHIDSNDQGGEALALSVSAANNLLFVANDTRGIESYNYDA